MTVYLLSSTDFGDRFPLSVHRTIKGAKDKAKRYYRSHYVNRAKTLNWKYNDKLDEHYVDNLDRVSFSIAPMGLKE